jgi:UDP-N-acetylglucosamine diphosphorylase/glucosamine-1-phosphate N-acetyltransferase
VNGILDEQTLAGLPTEEVSCSIADYPWDLVSHTSDQIEYDFTIIAKSTKKKISGTIYPGASLLNRKNIIVGRGSVLKPGVVLDAEHGSIIIGKNVTVMPNAVIIGPASIGDGSIIKVGAKIYHGASIGERCKVGGEVEASIIQSYSNKQHDGFLGHSYLGSWVNLGADTNTSDLKNTYGNVRVELHGKQIDTGYQFVGLMMGDHSKTGINVMFDTGTIVGVSCNIFGANLPPKNIPSFSWGQKNFFSVYDIEKGIETARKVMKRRELTMTAAYEKLMRNVFLQTENDRRAGGVS